MGIYRQPTSPSRLATNSPQQSSGYPDPLRTHLIGENTLPGATLMNLLYKHPTRCMLALVLLGAVSTCHAQTEASCSFTHFTPPFSALPRGINSFATVVGSSGTTS